MQRRINMLYYVRIMLLVAVLVVSTAGIHDVKTAYADKAGVCGVPGKDGPVTTLSGVINTYHPGTANVGTGATSIPIGGARAGGGPAIASGDLLLIIQMQGADMNSTNTNNYGNGVGNAGTAVNTVTYPTGDPDYAGGNVAANFSAGQYEYVVATGSVSGGFVPISTGLVNSYFFSNNAGGATQGQRRFQVIRVPQYSNAALGGILTASRWDGSTGGVLIFDVAGQLNWNGQTIDVGSLGFRGGGGRQLAGAAGNWWDFRTLATAAANGSKGEGYAGTPRYLNDNGALVNTGLEGYPNGSNGRGAAGNGGGGSTDGNPPANDQNSGGGGGGNGGYGGKGGNAWNSARVDGGYGGAPFPGSAPRLILGGGGGAGTTDNGTGTPGAGFASSGAAGGGVVFIRSGTVVGTGTINVNGADANQTVANDSGGGGGAGGSVVVIARNGGGSVGTLTVTTVGGKGGNAWATSLPGSAGPGAGNNHHGPGGGGGGGFVFTSGAVTGTSSVAGGLNGTSTTDASPFGATPGGAGQLVTNVTSVDIPPAISGANCVPVALTTTKTTSTPSVLAGSTATYTITVSNAAGAGGASGADISDVLPAGFTYASTGSLNLAGNAVRTVTTDPAAGTGTPTWGTFLIPGGGSVAITFTVNVGGGVIPGTYQNPATTAFLDPVRPTPAGSLTSTYNPASSTGEDVTVLPPPPADLAVTKTNGTTAVNAGGTTTYTLTLTNNGPNGANNATLSDPLVAGLTKTVIGACTPSGGAVCPTYGAGAGQMNIANLEAGTVVVPTLPSGGGISFTVTASVTAASGSVTNTFAAAPPAGITDPTPGNNSAGDTDTVTPVADLVVTKNDGVAIVNAGGATTYTLTLTNNGPSGANNATLGDPAMAGLTKTAIGTCTASGGAICPTAGAGAGQMNIANLEAGTVLVPTLPSGGSISFGITVAVTATSGSVANTFTATPPAGTIDPTPATATDTNTVVPVADLVIAKTNGAAAVNAGSTTSYTITVTNNGPSDVTGAVLSDPSVAGLTKTGVTCSASPGQCTAGTTPTVPQLEGGAFTLPALASGQTFQIVVTANVTAVTGSVTNSAVIAPPVGTINPGTSCVTSGGITRSFNGGTGVCTSTDTDPVTPIADLVVSKTNGVPGLNEGSITTYTIRSTNNGPSSVTGATLTDTVGAGLTATGVSCSAAVGNQCVSAPSLAALTGAGVSLPSLASGQFYEISLTADVTVTSGSVTNSSTITPPPGITNPGTSCVTGGGITRSFNAGTGACTSSDTDTVANLPNAVNDTATTNEGTPVTTDVLTNDDLGTGPTTITSNTQGANGTVSCTTTQCTYTPNAGFTGTDTYTYTITDANGNTSTATVTVKVSQALIGISKRVVSTVEISNGTWDVTYEFSVKNYGAVIVSQLQVVDNLSATFPLPTTFTVQSITSTQFIENTAYNGSTDTNLLMGLDSLAVGGSGTISLRVRIVPVSGGPFENVATVSGMDPNQRIITDDSQDGIDPDPDKDGDPTNNNDPTPLILGPKLFDPPFGVKTFDASGLPVLRWTMTWINNSNIVAVNAQVSDPIVSGTSYAGGLACSASGVSSTGLCNFEPASVTYPQGRVLWNGSIGPDPGATDAAGAANEVIISFNVTLGSGKTRVQNTATIDSDLNGDGDYTDPGEQNVASASKTWTAQSGGASSKLPATGFAPNVVTDLSNVPHETYLVTGGVTVEIPSLGVKIPIVGVPKNNGIWNVSWLGDQAGWLEGSAFPSWNGNSLLTGHVYLANGLPGPFVSLNKLKYGDRIIIHAYGQKYTFAVQTNAVVEPGNLTVMKHEDKPWLTLVTCKDYDDKTGTYKNRVVVRAVLVRVDWE